MKKILLTLIGISFGLGLYAQDYTWPKDPQVVQNIKKWQDQKFGIIIHWGVYAVPGIVESWSINSEDADWIPRDSTLNYDEYKKWYFNLANSFNPQQFNPEAWADVAAKAGMRYLVFTTKHHDGFSLFDTKQSDYKITNPAYPFAKHPKANVTDEVFKAFRAKDFLIGAYFSKPDWNSEYYWWPRYATPNRNNNYDVRLHPWRWEKFKEFTYNQLQELTSSYGKLDLLWLDGGWVRPRSTVNAEVLAWGAPIPDWDQDINMPKIAHMARTNQPGLIIVDRTVHGEFENYQTPEQKVPDQALSYPWETCMTIGDAWSYVANDKYKSTSTLVHLLVDVVAKGGNFLLGVGPKPDGTFPEAVNSRLLEMGEWMKINSQAIYSSQSIAPFKSGQTAFSKVVQDDGKEQVYAMHLLTENEPFPGQIEIVELPVKPKQVKLLGYSGKIKWKTVGKGITIEVPLAAIKLKHALVFQLTQ